MKKIEVFDGNQLHNEPVPYELNREKIKCSFFGDKYKIPIDDDLLSKHIMFLGGIGTGKTNAFSLIISQLIDNIAEDDIMIVFDTKGDFYKEFHEKALQKHGDIVISNDETAKGLNDADYWNIFNEIETVSKERIEEYVLEISKSLFYEKTKRTNQPFFPTAAQDLFGATMIHFLRNRDTLQNDNQSIKAFFDKSLLSEFREMLGKHEDMRAFVNYIAKDNAQTQGVMSELQQVTKAIFLGNFARQGTLSLRDLVRKKEGKVIFIEYDIGIGGILSPIYSLLFDLAIKESLRRKEGTRGNVYFIADEFRLLPNLQHIDDAVNFGRSLGVKFMIGIQNIEQIYECYGEFRARSIMSGFSTSVAFRVNDASSRQYIKDLYGQNKKKESFSSSVHARGLIENVRECYVVEDGDIINLKRGEAIIGLPGTEPFKFQFARYSPF